MASEALSTFAPRKTPVQARSTVTVDAISEATIQVLLSQGPERLTTTRVAERAGVSVGTLYQYYPNKQSVLFALLEKNLNQIASAVETACEQSRHKPISAMIKNVVEAFVDAKLSRADISLALYRIAPDVGGPALAKRAGQRLRKAIAKMLDTGKESPPDKFAIEIMFASMSGVMRHVLETGASPSIVRKLREHLVLLCQSYMEAVTNRPTDTGMPRVKSARMGQANAKG